MKTKLFVFSALAAVALGSVDSSIMRDLKTLESDIASDKESFAAVGSERLEVSRNQGPNKDEVTRWLKERPNLNPSQKLTAGEKDFIKRLANESEEDLRNAVQDLEWKDQALLWEAAKRILGEQNKATQFFSLVISGDHANDELNVSDEYIRHLASLSNADFHNWFLQTTREHRAKLVNKISYEKIRSLLGNTGGADFENRYNTELELYQQSQSLKDYSRANANVIYDTIMRVCGGYGNRYTGYESTLRTFRLLSATERKGSFATSQFEIALERAIQAKQPNSYAKGGFIYSLNAVDFARAAAELQGQGASYVKAKVIEILYKHYGGNVNGNILLPILRSDPSGMIDLLEGSSMDSQPLISKVVLDIGKLTTDPNQAVGTISEVIAQGVFDAAMLVQKPILNDQERLRFNSACHDLGVLVGSVQNNVKRMADVVRKQIEEGAFILKIFTKALSKVPVVGGSIQKYGDKAIDFESDREKKGVAKWESELKKAVVTLADKIFQSTAGDKSSTRQSFRDNQDQFETQFNEGVRKVLKA